MVLLPQGFFGGSGASEVPIVLVHSFLGVLVFGGSNSPGGSHGSGCL